ncbi:MULTISPECIES: hypothetical protein [Aminobacter]|uniref:Phage holin family protein n=1 Tax=Aminobacter niigataensis TaxID=83265 RepID=A0ABR6L100_9HYPH|nr:MULTISPECIES: hypothetical protein [Aminobacter]AWC22115.1 hypothetical protein CO731_01571 [Aminobacter sp. MSH1]MBB4650454.1 hypothetical protein [Aminobacter niigataensis]CAI2932858.1 conserved membrane protein of unknown function [Aminobacter niigataensis]
MLASLIAGFATGETTLALRRTRRAAVAYLAAGLAALCGVGFLVGAAFVWAARRFGHIEAALGFGLGLLVLAGLILLIHKLAAGARARADRKRRRTDIAALGTTAAVALLPTLLRSKGGIGAVLGPVVALAAYAIYRENRKSDDGDGPAGE